MSEQFLVAYVSGADVEVVERKLSSMDERMHVFFREAVERIDDYLPTCNELIEAHWNDKAMSVGALRIEEAPNRFSFNGAVYRHVCLERARTSRGQSDEHARKFANLEREVRRLDGMRHQVLQNQIDRDQRRESSLVDEIKSLRRHAMEVDVELSTAEAGEGFRLGLRVLGLVALLVMLPSGALLIARPVAWGTWQSAVVLGLFALGVFVVLRYLYVYSAFITGRLPLPNWSVQLLLLPRWWSKR